MPLSIDHRGASEVVSTILLIGVVITTTTIIGGGIVVGMNSLAEQTEKTHITIQPNVNDSAVKLQHTGGPDLSLNETQILLIGDSGRKGPYSLNSTVINGSGLNDGAYNISDSVSINHNFTGLIEIYLFSTKTDERLFHTIRSPYTGTTLPEISDSEDSDDSVPRICTECDGEDSEEIEHDTINDEDGFEDETLIVPEGTDFVPPEGSDGDDQSDPVDYTFKSYQIDGNVSSNESVSMTSTDGDIVIGESGSTVSGKQFDFDANGDIIIDGATLTTTAGTSGPGNERMTLTATGNISAVGTTLDAAKEIELTAEGTFIDLTDATVIVREGDSVTDPGNNPDLEITADNIVVNNTTFINSDDEELKRDMNGNVVNTRP